MRVQRTMRGRIPCIDGVATGSVRASSRAFVGMRADSPMCTGHVMDKGQSRVHVSGFGH